MEELIKISDLQERYKLTSPAAVRSRLDGAGITFEKQPKRGYITTEQLNRLDALNEHIRGGGAIATFAETVRRTTPVVVVESQNQIIIPEIAEIPETSITMGEMARLVDAVAEAIRPSNNGLENLEWLEKAAEYDWKLPTSKVKELIGVKPRATDETCYLWGSFTFIKSGKMGRETAWQVRRIGGGMGQLMKLLPDDAA
jgi:hypothetical protein